jgi:hypothetical protein
MREESGKTDESDNSLGLNEGERMKWEERKINEFDNSTELIGCCDRSKYCDDKI